MQNLIKEVKQSKFIQMRKKMKKVLKFVSKFSECKSVPTALQNSIKKLEQVIVYKIQQQKKQRKPIDLSFYHYCFQKLNFNPIQEIFPKKKKQETKFIFQEQFKQLYYVNPKCVGCSKIFIKSLPLHFSEQKDFTPFLVVNQDQVDTQFIKKAICSILNQGGGFLILTAKSIKKNNQALLTQGFLGDSNIAKLQVFRLISKCIEMIFPVQQRERPNIDIIELKQSIQSLQKGQKNQFVIRVTFIVKNNYHRRIFYIKNQLKNFAPSFQLYKLKKTMENDRQPLPTKLQKNQIYQQIVKTFYKEKKLKISYKCLLHCQNQQTNCIINDNTDQINVKLPKCFQKPEQIRKFVFSSIEKDFFRSICKIFYENLNYLKKEFRKVQQKESCVIFQFNEKANSIEHMRKIQSIFHASKIKYEKLYPYPLFQNSLADFRKKQKSNTINYQMICYIFEGKFVNFLQSIKNKFGQHFSEQFMLHFVNNQIKIGCSMNQNQINDFSDLIKDTFQIQPPNITKISLATFTSQKSYKSITITFKSQQINASLYSFLIFLVTRKRPKCVY